MTDLNMLLSCFREKMSASEPEESALRFSDCTETSVIVEGADACLHCYWTVEAGHSFP